MRVIVCEPNKTAYVKEIDAGLKPLQNEVGGYIEVIYPFDAEVGIVCNEDGKITGLPLNRGLYGRDGKLYDILAGTFVIVGLGEEDFRSLTDEEEKKYMKRFRDPHMFFKMNGEIVAMPVAE